VIKENRFQGVLFMDTNSIDAGLDSIMSLNGATCCCFEWNGTTWWNLARFNSLGIIPVHIVEIINEIDTFLLTMAMSALGMGTILPNSKVWD